MKGIPVEEQRLLFAGEEYPEKYPVSNLPNLQKDSTLSLIHRGAIIQISVRFDGKDIRQKSSVTQLNVGILDTIEHIRIMMDNDGLGIPVSQQMLFFEGKQLEDNKNICDYNIKHKSQLKLVLKTFRSGKR